MANTINQTTFPRIVALALSTAALTALGNPVMAQDSVSPTLKKLTLTLSGVAYHEWMAPKDAKTVDLAVRLDDVDDVLRSIAGIDGTRLTSVTLPGPNDTASAFDALPFQATAFDDVAALLNALRGNEVSVPIFFNADNVVGTLVSAERRNEMEGTPPQSVIRTRVTIKTTGGLAQFVLENVSSFRFTDAALNARIDAALAAARQTTNSEIRQAVVSLQPAPDGTARFATVTKAPLWKSAYRLQLPADSTGTAKLSGWAVIENTDTSDWKGVDLTLQSGNPVSFRQPIYQRYDVQRPEAAIDQQQHGLPRIDQREFSSLKTAPQQHAALSNPTLDATRSMALAAPAPKAPSSMMVSNGVASSFASQGVFTDSASDAPPSAGGVGELFHLSVPVTLAAGQSASLPFLETRVPYEKVDLLSYDSANPMRSVRVTNDTAATWPSGAVSTQDSEGFAGDSRLSPLPPGESRFLTYATDFTVAAHWDHRGNGNPLVAFKVSGGVATFTRKTRTTTVVDVAGTAASHGDSASTVIVELPREQGATFSVRGAEEAPPTASSWRARVKLGSGPSQQVVFNVDHPVKQTVELSYAKHILMDLQGQDLDGLSPANLAALKRITDMQTQHTQADTKISSLEQDKKDAVADQARARDNAKALSGNSTAGSRYITQIGDLETRIQDLTDKIAQAKQENNRLETAIETAVSAFSVDCECVAH